MSQRVTAGQVGNQVERPSPRTESFQMRLYRAITGGLSDVLGAAGAQATSFHLGLKPTTGAAAFHDGLVRMFGTGAQALELSILRELYSGLGSAFDPEESKTFVDYVSDAKKMRAEKEE